MKKIHFTVMSALSLVPACDANDGRIDVAWTGADTGRFEVPASAEWCAGDSLVMISGESGDSGFAAALLTRDSLTRGVYPIGEPVAARPRPGSRVALRWAGETLIEGYHGMSGVLTVEPGEPLHGKIEATMKSVTDGGQINLTGTFDELRVTAGQPAQCGLAPASLPDSAG
jgi:hypothetical protein